MLFCSAGFSAVGQAHAESIALCQVVREEVQREVNAYYKTVIIRSIRDQLRDQFMNCIERHPVCMGGYNERREGYLAAVWHAEGLTTPISPKFVSPWSPGAKSYEKKVFPDVPGTTLVSDRDEMYFALLQVPKALDGHPACIFGYNNQASAYPWGMEAWRIKDGHSEKVKLQGVYAPPFNGRKGGMFTTGMRPEDLRTLMLDIYDYEVAHMKR